MENSNGMGLVIRLALLMTNYGKPLDWSDKKLDDAKTIYSKWMDALDKHYKDMVIDKMENDDKLVEYLCNDLNTVGAIAHLGALAKQAIKGDSQSAHKLAFGLNLMGFIPPQTQTNKE